MAEAYHSDMPTHAVHTNNKQMLATVPYASKKWDKCDSDDDLDDTNLDYDNYKPGKFCKTVSPMSYRQIREFEQKCYSTDNGLQVKVMNQISSFNHRGIYER